MTLWDLVKRNMAAARGHHLMTGVLACLITALLTAALTVAGAIQKSFRENAVSRYGRIEAALVSHAPLPQDLHTRLPRLEAEYLTVPVWQEDAVARSETPARNAERTSATEPDHANPVGIVDAPATSVACRVFAVPPMFGRFGWHGTRLHLDGNAVALGADLARDLDVRVGETFTLQAPVPGMSAHAEPPAEADTPASPTATQADPPPTIHPPRTLTLLVKEILHNPAPGAFALRHDRIDTRTLFIDHAWYMRQTGRDADANRLFFGSAQDTRLQLNHRAVEITLQGTLTIADYGMTLTPDPDAEAVWRLTGADLPSVMHTLRAQLHPFVLEDTDDPDALRFRMTPATSFDEYIAHRPRNERERLLAMPPAESFDLFLREALWNSPLGYRLAMVQEQATSAARGSLSFAGFAALLMLPLLVPMAFAISRLQRRAYGRLRPILRILLTLGFTHDQTRGQVLTGGLAAVLAGVVPGAILGLGLAHVGVAYLGDVGAVLVGGMPMRLLPDFLFLSTGIGGGMVVACAMVWLAARPAKRWTLLGLRQSDLPPPPRAPGTHPSTHTPNTPTGGSPHPGGIGEIRAAIGSARFWVALLGVGYILALTWMLMSTGRPANPRPPSSTMTMVRTVLPVPSDAAVRQGAASPTAHTAPAADKGEVDDDRVFVGEVALDVGILVEGESIAPGTPTRPLRPRILGLPPQMLDRITLYIPDGEGSVRLVSGHILGEDRSDHHVPVAANGYSAYWLLHRGLGTTLTLPGLRGAAVPAHVTGVFHTLPAADALVMSAANVRRYFSHLPAARVLLLPPVEPENTISDLDLDPQPMDADMLLHALAAYHPTLHTLETEHAAYRRWVDAYRHLLLLTVAGGLLLLLALEALLGRLPSTPVRLPLQAEPGQG